MKEHGKADKVGRLKMMYQWVRKEHEGEGARTVSSLHIYEYSDSLILAYASIRQLGCVTGVTPKPGLGAFWLRRVLVSGCLFQNCAL